MMAESQKIDSPEIETKLRKPWEQVSAIKIRLIETI